MNKIIAATVAALFAGAAFTAQAASHMAPAGSVDAAKMEAKADVKKAKATEKKVKAKAKADVKIAKASGKASVAEAKADAKK